MAVVKPFRGVRYNPELIADMRTVVSQPYDRIDETLQQQYYDLSPYNIVRIIQGQPEANDRPTQPDGPNVYTRARAFYRDWLDQGVLARNGTPAFYAYEQTFSVADRSYTRLGLIAAVELTDFDEGIILPHELTHAGPKEDRLRLLQTMQANSEQIFILYPDAENRVNALVRQAIAGREPDIDVVEIWESAVQQRLWAIYDDATLAAIEAEFAPKRNLIIADGHHRYGTGLTYRDQQRAAHPHAPSNAAFNFVQATLVSMDDPGLVVLPTHREICDFSVTTPSEIIERVRADANFSVTAFEDLDAALAAINADSRGLSFGFYGGSELGYFLLTLVANIEPASLITDAHSSTWKSLSVSILHRILLEQIAEVPVSGIEDKTMIRYHRDPKLAVSNVDSGVGNFVFFISATRMDQIRTVAAGGEQMPQKSTDFYPKVISGLSLLPVAPDERL